MSNTLQELQLSSIWGADGLCWRLDGSTPPSAGTVGRTAITIGPGQTASFDTFLNCFYERYWRDLTFIQNLSVEIEASGPCLIRLVRRSTAQPADIQQETGAGEARALTTLVATAASDEPGGVLYVEVQSLGAEVTVHGGRWLTDQAKANPVALAIVICSFGREQMLTDTLRGVAHEVARCEAIAQVVIVHQGTTDLEKYPPLSQLINDDAFAGKLRVVRQDNFGGSGGFARGLIEATTRDATDILLMDDDIRLELSILSRLTRLLAYLKQPTTIGGQMFDLRDPTMLRASHESVDLDTLALVNPCRRIDMAPPGATALFQTRHTSAYNGWWFCSIPASLIARTGLPLPMFIRHDDTEHGLRTTRGGSPLVTMPGLFVWHEPFENKIKPWQTYYDRRNMLITAALHGRVRAVRQAMLLLREGWASLIIHRYEFCWALCRSAEDYMKGPEFAFTGSRDRHGEIVAETARYALLAVIDHRLRQRKGARPPAEPARLKKLRRSIGFLWWLSVPCDAHRSRARTTRQLALSLSRAVSKLLLQRDRVASQYRTRAAWFASASSWKEQLGMPDGSGPGP